MNKTDFRTPSPSSTNTPAGSRSRAQRVGRFLQTSWSIVGIGLLLFVLLELSLRGLGAVLDRVAPDSPSEPGWPVQAWREEAATTLAWQPYVYWRRREFTGRDVNVDERGLRRTVQAAAAAGGAPRARRVFCFGGSTMWGSGVADAGTIPSQLARELANVGGQRREVWNFGEAGYVQNQELIALMRRVQQGDVPDVAVFYDSFNDVNATLQNRSPGIPMNEFNRRQEFNLLNHPSLGGGLALAARGLSTYKLFANERFGEYAQLFKANGKWFFDEGVDELAKEHLRTIRMANALAREYGFRCLFYWQPTVHDKPHKTAVEQAIVAQHAGGLFETALERARYRQRLEGDQSLVFLNDVFNDCAETVFLDECHLNAAGNAIVARRIARDLAPLFEAN